MTMVDNVIIKRNRIKFYSLANKANKLDTRTHYQRKDSSLTEEKGNTMFEAFGVKRNLDLNE